MLFSTYKSTSEKACYGKNIERNWCFKLLQMKYMPRLPLMLLDLKLRGSKSRPRSSITLGKFGPKPQKGLLLPCTVSFVGDNSSEVPALQYIKHSCSKQHTT